MRTYIAVRLQIVLVIDPLLMIKVPGYQLLLQVSGKPLSCSCLILVVFIDLLSASYLHNIVDIFMVQMYDV